MPSSAAHTPGRRLVLAALLAALASAAASDALTRAQLAAAPAAPADAAARVDAVFAPWDSTRTPGCAVGVARDGRPILERAYGMADLEQDRPNTPGTIFEAGSVSKQFTAAAVLLLAQEGRLSLDDPIRRHVPEVPDYGRPITIRHLLTHTSGLRDWGTVAEAAGWPRTTRAYTHAHVLDIVSRQRALNFDPGAHHSYSNTGYNLAAVLVARVSGQPFADFTRVRLFDPLGMAHTSWRDDHRRIVRGRATAYVQDRGDWRILMPFEDVHGNGGLLTTVGDLLAWNENFVHGRVGGAAFVAEQQRRGRLDDGREIEYAAGLYIRTWRGVREVSHSGATAGYRAFLARYPDQRLSVAVLCNAGNANTTRLARQVAEIYLGSALAPQPTLAPAALPPAAIGKLAGVYRHTLTGDVLRVVAAGATLRIDEGPSLTPVGGARFAVGDGESRAEFDLDGAGRPTLLRLVAPNGDEERFAAETPVAPSVEALEAYAGDYTSDEVETTFTAAVEHGRLVLHQRPDRTIVLSPAWADTFSSSLGTVRFRRGAGGRIDALSLVMPRAWNLVFVRAGAPSSGSGR
jgi:CubicO group peptidase (beta-lactamase class C family)